MTDLRTAAQQALEAWDGGDTEWFKRAYTVMEALRSALADPVLQTCNCRWDGEMQMQQCTLHEAHVDAIKEWAQRAKFAEKKLAALAEPVLNPAPGYCKHCKQYTIEEPLPAEPVQEPYCYVYEYDSPHGLHREFYPREYNGMKPTRTVQVYTAPPQRKLAEPVQEPVAWIHTDPDKRRVKFLEWRENEPGYRGDWIKTPLFTAPGDHDVHR